MSISSNIAGSASENQRTTLGQRRLSVAMIVRDAADLIAASLESVRDIADEIIVVDTGSTDRTRDIALPRASRVLSFDWSDDFSAARNFCLQHITGDWVLWLDAGESLDKSSTVALRQLIDSNPDSSKAYLLMVQVPSLGQPSAGEQTARLRLHPNRREIEFTGRVREEIYTVLAAAGMTIEMSTATIRRTAREHDPELKRAKAQRNLRLTELDIQEHGLLPESLLVLGDAWAALGEIQLAVEAYSRALEMSAVDSTLALESYYGLLAALDHVPAARDKQVELCSAAISAFPYDAQLLCAMGSYLQNQGRLDLASRAFESAARFGQVNPETWHLTEIADVATVCHAMCQELLGQVESAIATLTHAAAIKPQSVRLRRQLLELYVRHNRRKDALEQVLLLPVENSNREASKPETLRSAVRGACLAAQQNWIPALAYLQTAHSAGCRDSLCLRWLTTTLLAIEDCDGAQRVLAQWQAIEPDNLEVKRFSEQLRIRRLPIHDETQQPAVSNSNAYEPNVRGGVVNNVPTAKPGLTISIEGRQLRLDGQESPIRSAPLPSSLPSRHNIRARP